LRADRRGSLSRPDEGLGQIVSFVATHWFKTMDPSSRLIPQLFEVNGQFCKTIRVELNLQRSFIPTWHKYCPSQSDVSITFVCSFFPALVANIIPFLLASRVTVRE
jgi:hypothetical protein